MIKYCFLLIFFFSCRNFNNSKPDKIISNHNLVTQQIGKSKFYISLPKEYSIKEKRGPDFFIYYFSPSDTLIKNKFSCGIYFGNFPHEFEANNDSCKAEVIRGKILNDSTQWKLYNCQGDYLIQTIAEINKGEGNDFIHAFGQANSMLEISQILEIYSTLTTNNPNSNTSQQ